MRDSIKNGIVYTVIFSFLVSFVFVILLALANEATLPQVEINRKIADNASILNALQIPLEQKGYSQAVAQEIDQKFAQFQVQAHYFKEIKNPATKAVTGYTHVAPEDGAKMKADKDPTLVIVYSAQKNDQVTYAKPFVGFGLWGSIPGVIAFNQDLTRTAGLEIYPGRHSETPGLGARMEEKWFKDQLIGEALNNGFIKVAKPGEGSAPADPKNKDDGIVDGITGATLTSKGLEKAFSDEYAAMKKLMEVMQNGR